jgi:hypothetical protein
MTKEQIKERISNALEAELATIYNELNITDGDICPSDSLIFDEIADQAAILFSRLIEWNS